LIVLANNQSLSIECAETTSATGGGSCVFGCNNQIFRALGTSQLTLRRIQLTGGTTESRAYIGEQATGELHNVTTCKYVSSIGARARSMLASSLSRSPQINPKHWTKALSRSPAE
jgi:hypothetical protein